MNFQSQSFTLSKTASIAIIESERSAKFCKKACAAVVVHIFQNSKN